jgi:hypothetical protein
MKTFAASLQQTTMLAIVLVAISGCESTDGGATVSAGAYYETGLYDPWYYGGYYDDPDIIVTPPPGRPEAPPQPTHPIASPPASVPRPTPMPSIPSAPRPSGRR